MAQQNLNLGTVANDGTGDSIRLGGQKIEANFTELYTIKLESVGAGTNVSIDNTDPINPIINVTGLSSYTFTNGLTESSGTVTWYNELFPGVHQVPIDSSTALTIGTPGDWGITVINGISTTLNMTGDAIVLNSSGNMDIDGSSVDINSAGTFNMVGDTISISSTNPILLDTPAIQATTAITGQSLILQNAASGESEFGFPGKQVEETTSFSLINATHNNAVIIINNGASAVNITVPTGLPNGFKCGFIQRGTGTVTFVPSSTTLNSANGLIIDGQYNQAYIEKRNAGTNEFFVLGNLTT